MKILVTGGAGFIGSQTTNRLLVTGNEVVCLDNFNHYYPPAVKKENIKKFLTHKSFKLYQADICDPDKLRTIFRKEKPDKVCHLAAQVGVRASLEDPFSYIRTNIYGTTNLLKVAVENHIKGIVFASSSSVYGQNKKIPFAESDPTDKPISPYAMTKKAAEMVCFSFHHLYGLPITILRLFSVYGPSGRPDMAPFLFTKAVAEGKIIKIFGSGKTKRDFTYIDDITNGIVTALKKSFSFEIINLGSHKAVELTYLIAVIEKELKKKAKLKFLPPHPGDVPVTLADISRAKRLLAYQPQTSIEEGMARFIAWYEKD